MAAAYWFLPLQDQLGIPEKEVFAFPEARPALEQSEFTRFNTAFVSEIPESQGIKRVLSLFVWQIEESEEVTDHQTAAAAAARRAFPDTAATPATPPIPSEYEYRRVFTVIEVACVFYDQEDHTDADLSQILDEAISQIQRLQRAYSLAAARSVRLLTLQTLPLSVPFTRCSVDKVGPKIGSSDITLYTIPHNFRPLMPPPQLGQDSSSLLREAINRDGSVFSGFVESYRDADSSIIFRGDARSSLLASATAAEVFLDDLLRHLLWEEGTRPEEAAGYFDDPRITALPRAIRHTSAKLGGMWQKDREGPVKAWQENVARIRNRVIHAGYTPSIAEAEAALKSVIDLQELAFTQLRKKLNRYPRTGLAGIGTVKLEEEKRLTANIRRLMEADSPGDWTVRFVRWRSCIAREVERRQGLADQPSVDRAYLILVASPDGTTDWVLHDRDCHLATSVAPAPELLTPKQGEALFKISSVAKTRREVISMAIEDGPKLTPTADWVEEHRRLPLCEVMVNGNDFY